MNNSKGRSATAYEWLDLLARLVHVHIEPAKESHDVPVDKMFRLLTEDGKSHPLEGDAHFPLYHLADVNIQVDALVTGVQYHPPHIPPRDEDAIFPHGRLTLTFDIFLNQPLVIEQTPTEQANVPLPS